MTVTKKTNRNIQNALYIKIPYSLVETCVKEKKRYSLLCFICLRTNLLQISHNGYKVSFLLEEYCNFCRVSKNKKSKKYKEFIEDLKYVCNLYLKNFDIDKDGTYYIKDEYVDMFEYSYNVKSPYIKIPVKDVFDILNENIDSFTTSERSTCLHVIFNIMCIIKTKTCLKGQKNIEVFMPSYCQNENVTYSIFTHKGFYEYFNIKHYDLINAINILKKHHLIAHGYIYKYKNETKCIGKQFIAYIYGKRISDSDVVLKAITESEELQQEKIENI